MSDEKQLKLVLVGQSSVGKTCIVKKATIGVFADDIAPTLGASFVSKTIEIDKSNVTLQIWDTAGQERYRGMTPMYYRGAHVALLVYSIIDESSFSALDSWVSSIKEEADPSIILYFAGNKCDVESQREVSYESGLEKANHYGAQFFEVSAKTGYGIEDLFTAIAKSYIDQKASVEFPNENELNLNQETKRKKKCCK